MSKVLFIDVETTGLSPYKNGIIQISCIPIIHGDIKDSIDIHLKPHTGSEIDPKALQVNGIGLEELENGEGRVTSQTGYKIFSDKLSGFVNKYDKNDKMYFMAYNARFDYDFLRQWFLVNGDKYFGSYFFFPPIDIMNAAILHFYNNDNREALLNFKQETVAKELGIDITKYNLHDSLDDIKVTLEIAKRVGVKV